MRSGDENTDMSAYDLEFRSTADDAWYNVRVVLESETFIVKFWNFTEASDERFHAGDFQTLRAVDDFVRRFRPVSAQLQDNQCSKLVKGFTLCSSFDFKCDDVRFYDAVIEAATLQSLHSILLLRNDTRREVAEIKVMRSVDESTDISAYDLEFRSAADNDAWYSVRVLLEGETLTVKFLDFPESSDEKYSAADFQTLQAVYDFGRRFRPLSAQLQDNQCSKLVEGLRVCSSFDFKCDDVRFYDAVVEAVHHEEHSFATEEEECLCTFVLCWQHGPNMGNLTFANIASICLIQSAAELDFRVASFAKMAKEKLEIASLKSGAISEGNLSLGIESNDDACDNKICVSSLKSSLFHHGLQETKSFRQFGSAVRTTEAWLRTDQDQDFGGETFNMNGTKETGGQNFILVDNLEINLSPFSIINFIQKQTSISPLAYVFPSLSSESYARAAIVLDCKKKHKSVYQFLDNPDHVITSTKGRPWLVSEQSLRHGTFRTTLGSLMPKSQYKIQNKIIDDELKIVHSGTEEYRTAKRLRVLYKDFADHQKRLHRTLALEERKILQSSRSLAAAD